MLYDTQDPKSIEAHGKHLMGGTLGTVPGVAEVPFEEAEKVVSGRTRGLLGYLVERYYFGIEPKNEGTPDFPEAGVELKTTPAKKNRNGTYSAKERLVLGMIDYLAEAERDFSTSSYYTKNEKLMLLSYLHEEGKRLGDVRFLLAKLYEFHKLPKEDQRIIREDWEKIHTKIKEGRAHELSEGDTLYLGACTKSATSKNRREQVSGIPAKPRAFSYKQSYMTQLLRRELGTIEDVERLIAEDEVDERKTFEEQVLERFSPFIGKSVTDIIQELGVDINKNRKDRFAVLARAMMGIKGRRIEEFEAAGVTMKTIQLKSSGKPKEAMSFPTFKYKEIVDEVWDGDEEEGEIRSSFQKQLESRFLFIVFRCADKCKPTEERIFEKAFFWTMPQKDLEEAQRVWEEAKERIKAGRADELPTSSESPVAHVRPHGRNAQDTYETPQGKQVSKKCFWLNTDYIQNVTARA